MLIYTTITPRRDGKVFADCGGVRCEFSDNGSGILVCEVADADHAKEISGRGGGLFGVLLVQGKGQEPGASGESSAPSVVSDPEEAPKKRRGRPPRVGHSQHDRPAATEEQP